MKDYSEEKIFCVYCDKWIPIEEAKVTLDSADLFSIRCPHCGERDAIPTHASGFDIDKILRIKNVTRLMVDAFCENERSSIDNFTCASSSVESLRELSWRNQTAQNGFEPTLFIEALKG